MKELTRREAPTDRNSHATLIVTHLIVGSLNSIGVLIAALGHSKSKSPRTSLTKLPMQPGRAEMCSRLVNAARAARPTRLGQAAARLAPPQTRRLCARSRSRRASVPSVARERPAASSRAAPHGPGLACIRSRGLKAQAPVPRAHEPRASLDSNPPLDRATRRPRHVTRAPDEGDEGRRGEHLHEA